MARLFINSAGRAYRRACKRGFAARRARAGRLPYAAQGSLSRITPGRISRAWRQAQETARLFESSNPTSVPRMTCSGTETIDARASLLCEAAQGNGENRKIDRTARRAMDKEAGRR